MEVDEGMDSVKGITLKSHVQGKKRLEDTTLF
jgi:hypothetical protein